ncbi:MAG: hypothetical protein D6736_16220 [Nitrospinota bacterium]|nr:MAG: hypothetical protein D6736_16220 [Nitrospinota bacterium]
MHRHRVVLFLIGTSLSIAQFIMIRDLVTVLYGEEVVIILVTTSFFFGLSIGYVFSLLFSERVFKILLVLSLFLHLTFPYSYRYLAAYISTLDMSGYAYGAWLLAYALIFNAIFATFLPRFISQRDGETERLWNLKVFYTLEILGFMVGFFLVSLLWNRRLVYLLLCYWMILAILLHLILTNRGLTVIYVGTALLTGVFLPTIDLHSTAMLYRYKHGLRGARALFSINSPYQKVEVIEDAQGGRHLYLDGLENLNSTDLAVLNYYIATLPASLIRPEKSLLIGNGTLSSVQSVSQFSHQVISVELDPGVLLAGKQFFTNPAGLRALKHWRLYVDDGKHFLRRNRDTYDLIIMDIPSPLTIQEAYLHTVEFYRIAQKRLNPDGVIAVQLSGPLQRNNRTPARVVAALRQVFREVMVIHSDKADRSFAYASMHLPFGKGELLEKGESYERRIKIVTPSQLDAYLTQAVPLSVDRMDLVLRRGLERFMDRYFEDD